MLLMDPIPSLSKVYSLMIQEETQRSIPNAPVVKVDSTILAAKVSTDQVNQVTNLVNSGGKGKDRPVCTHCGKTGHTVDKCYKLHGFPPGFKFKNKPAMAHQVSSRSSSEFVSPMHQFSAFTSEQCQQLLALFGASNPSLATSSHVSADSMVTTTPSSTSANVVMTSMNFSHSVFAAQVVNRRAYGGNTWVLDTGATNHFVCSVDLLNSITGIRQSLVQLPNGESAQETHIWTITLSSSLILKNVLCVPSFSFNLLSISSLTHSQPYCCVFLSAYC